MSESNIIKCPDCGKEISAKAQNCPNCGRPLNSAAKKKGKPILTVILLIFLWPIGLIVMWATNTFNKTARIIITLLFIAVAAVFFTSGTKTEKAPDNGTQAVAEDKTEEASATENAEETASSEAAKNIAFGSEGTIADGLSLIVNNAAEANSISEAGGYVTYEPDSGKYAIINVTIKNTSKTSKSLLLNYFNLIDSSGAKYAATVIIGADEKYLTADSVNPNMDISGNLVFEVPSNAVISDFMLEYSDFDIFSEAQHFSLK